VSYKVDHWGPGQWQHVRSVYHHNQIPKFEPQYEIG